ncbi:MAG: HAMP domain-containing protein [Treponema sp.]|jgi:adenylate cyclase|nr:HAMP domain-containing protein [Treponema sp.]
MREKREKKLQEDDTGLMTVKFSIGAKLITIISSIVIISLGSIIFLVSWLVSEDLQILAEENNFETNRRSAMAAESVFENIQSNSMALIRTITSVGSTSLIAWDSTEFFFERNPNVASVFFTDNGRDEILLNDSFFDSRQIDASLAESFRDGNRTALRRAGAGETVLLNAAPHFSAPVIALFYPMQNAGIGVVFSPMDLNDSFGHAVNHSFLLNDRGDILIHGDFEIVRTAVNVADSDFTKYIWNNPERSAQTLYTSDEGIRYFGAFTKLNIAGAVVVTDVEYNKIFEGIAATTRRNIYLTITVLSISIILLWFFSKSISVPLEKLAVAANEIEGGSFEFDLKPKGRDEIGLLTSSFSRMCKALTIFGRFTNRHIAVGAMRGEIKPGGFPKHATIFFSDIRDFTAISENFTTAFPDEASDRIVQWLNNYFTQMIDCVERTNGVVDKFIGDAVMAHWGTAYTSGSTRKDAYNCISSALMMRRALFRINKGRSKDNPENPRIRIGCGINTGMVTAGQLGSDVRMEYTVTGDPVNLASRVESLNKTFATDILITEETWRLVRKKFITEEMPSVTVKGKEKPVRIFAVINYAKATKGPKSLARLRKILGIKDPGILKLDANSTEKKYKIVGM